MIKIKSTKIPDVKIIEPELFKDDRGHFFESFNQKEFNENIGLNVNFVQDNHSKSTHGVLRGLHYQKPPYQQAKLVRVLFGEVFDVAVDIRENSHTYGSWVGELLSANNRKQLWIPEGFAHGFYVLSNQAELVYKVNEFYKKSHEQIIHWQNNSFNIEWPIIDGKVFLSNKDSEGKPYIIE